MSEKTRNHDRRPENTKVSISLPISLLATIDQRVKNEHRSRSNMIALMIIEEMQKTTANQADSANNPEKT